MSAIFVALSVTVLAQNFPQDSPNEMLKQRLGVSDVTIEYSRPSVKGRTIFGGLVPYGKVWRTGANYPTFITFPDSVTIENKYHLPPGKYALYTIPYKDKWTIIFSNNISLWGAFGYLVKDDALRVDVKPIPHPFTETFTIAFDDLTYETATLHMEWERLTVPLKISVDNYNSIIRYMQTIVPQDTEKSNDWGIYMNAAKYLMYKKRSLPQAMTWINRSIDIEQNFNNLWVKAELSAYNKDYKNAVKFGKMALQKGEETKVGFVYHDVYRLQINRWQKLVSPAVTN